MQACDLLIVCGARFDDRATGDLKRFAPHAKVVHFDADPAEIGKVRTAHVSVVGSLPDVLRALDPGPLAIGPWVASTAAGKAGHAPRYDAPGEGVFAPRLAQGIERDRRRPLRGRLRRWASTRCGRPNTAASRARPPT